MNWTKKGKVSFFKKNRNNQVNIWALIDITDMDRNDVLLLNDKFAEFWINEMSRGKIFAKGVYPFGFHCIIYYLHAVFRFDTYVILCQFFFHG